ncbi:MAG: hypothetical protein V7603_6741 [Micromonosporaceae bacterium]
MPAHIQSKAEGPTKERHERRTSPARRDGLRIPGLRITPDGRLAVDLERPTFHALVFGSSLVALTRILLARLSQQPTGALISAYLGAIVGACVLGKLAQVRMKDRTPRLYTSGMSFTALALYAAPGALPHIVPTAASNRFAIGAMLVVGLGTTIAELLHRIGCVSTGLEEPVNQVTDEPPAVPVQPVQTGRPRATGRSANSAVGKPPRVRARVAGKLAA